MAKLWLEAGKIKMEYAGKSVLDIDNLQIYEGDRIGLVGENGAGKSTLIKILSGEIAPDAGSVRSLVPIAVIKQMDAGEKCDCPDMALAAQFRVQTDREGLSGGERTRRRIASALSKRSHLLFADEPTTDLDREGVARITKKLLEWDGAFVLVSHDRTLLDEVVDKIWEIEDGRVSVYDGNFSDYRREKERKRDFERFEYEQYRTEKSRLKKSIQGAREKASQINSTPKRMGLSEARLHKREANASKAQIDKSKNALASRLEHLEEKRRPREDAEIVMKLGANSPIPARFAVEARDITLSFENRPLLENADILLPKGTRTALLGPNGCGKTTLMNYIASAGRGVYVHPQARLGVFGQDGEKSLDLNKSAIDNVMYTAVTDESTARTVLARLDMRSDSVKKPVSVLSGGERAKVSLARLLVSDANLLLLDEPTNHLDIFMLEAMAEMLGSYAGTLLFVSHDRWFTGRVATRTVEFKNKKLITTEG